MDPVLRFVEDVQNLLGIDSFFLTAPEGVGNLNLFRLALSSGSLSAFRGRSFRCGGSTLTTGCEGEHGCQAQQQCQAFFQRLFHRFRSFLISYVLS